MPPTAAQFEKFLAGYSVSPTDTICIEKSVILLLLHKAYMLGANIKKDVKNG